MSNGIGTENETVVECLNQNKDDCVFCENGKCYSDIDCEHSSLYNVLQTAKIIVMDTLHNNGAITIDKQIERCAEIIAEYAFRRERRLVNVCADVSCKACVAYNDSKPCSKTAKQVCQVRCDILATQLLE